MSETIVLMQDKSGKDLTTRVYKSQVDSAHPLVSFQLNETVTVHNIMESDVRTVIQPYDRYKPIAKSEFVEQWIAARGGSL